MSAEKFVEGLGRQISRRAFLAEVGTSTVAALLALLGLPKTALASCSYVTYKCCCLCQNPSGPCSGGCPTSSASGKWCWYCEFGAELWKCCECKEAGATCDGSCNNIIRSYAVLVGGAPAR